ncbi:MAG: hypothetical protein QNK37_07180 [Acidobacteriota bacterium]|nr:hypothetical protein [Acidobacteriota bacterium]
MKEKLRALIAIAVILLTISCGKKQDLISKAFEDKNFDKPLEKIEQDPKGLKDKDEEDQDTKIEVLVDRIAEDPDDQAHFIETGDTKRPRPDLLALRDLCAPEGRVEGVWCRRSR